MKLPRDSPPLIPSPSETGSQLGRGTAIPAKAGIQVFEIVDVSNFLDASLRWHDELRHTLIKGKGIYFLFRYVHPLPSPERASAVSSAEWYGEGAYAEFFTAS